MAEPNWPGDTPQDDVPGLNQSWDSGTPPPPPPPTHGRPAPSPEEIRTWAILAHASAYIAAFFALAFLGPLVVWLLRKDVDEISGLHAKEALNFNLTILLYGGISIVLFLFLIGIPMLIAVALFWFVNVLRAIIKVANGQTFSYPLTIRFIP